MSDKTNRLGCRRDLLRLTVHRHSSLSLICSHLGNGKEQRLTYSSAIVPMHQWQREKERDSVSTNSRAQKENEQPIPTRNGTTDSHVTDDHHWDLFVHCCSAGVFPLVNLLNKLAAPWRSLRRQMTFTWSVGVVQILLARERVIRRRFACDAIERLEIHCSVVCDAWRSHHFCPVLLM
jgi:hypothetical protein